MEEQESDFIMHTPCTKCGSSDANSLYSDGHTYCFNCKTYGQSQEEVSVTEKAVKDISFKTGDYQPLVKRCLTEKTTKFWDYQVGQGTHIANYKDADGNTVAQKLRYPDKTFSVVGDLKKAVLYGQH